MIQHVATHIELRENRAGHSRAYIAGTRIGVQDIYAQAEVLGMSAEKIVESLPDLTLGQVHAALSYLYDHRQEIVAGLKADEDFANQLKSSAGPSLLSQKLNRVTGI